MQWIYISDQKGYGVYGKSNNTILNFRNWKMTGRYEDGYPWIVMIITTTSMMPWLFILGRGWGCRGGCFSPVVSRFTFTSLTGLVRYIYPKLAEEQCTLVERETFFVDNWSMLDIVWFVDALSYLSWWFQSFFPPVSGRFNGHQAALESIEMAKHAAEAWITGRMRMSWNCLIQRTLWQLGAYKTTGPYRCKVSAMAATVSSWLENPGWSDDVRWFSHVAI